MIFRPFIAAVLACLAPAGAQENLFIQTPKPAFAGDRTQVEATALFSVAPPTGFLPLRVTVINDRKNDGVVRLNCRSEIGSGSRDTAVASEFTLNCPAQQTSSRDFLMPLATLFENVGYVGSGSRVDLSGSFGSGVGSIATRFDPQFPAIVMGETLFTPNSSALDAETTRRARSYSGSPPVFAASFSATRLPDDWRAYAGYDAMIVTDDEWRAMTPGARAAVLQWIRLGGWLNLYCKTTTNFSALGIETPSETRTQPYGLGTVERIDLPTGSLTLDPKKTVGRYHRASRPWLNQSIHNDYRRSWPLHLNFGEQGFDYLIFILVLIAFGVLVGPINLFVFAKSGQRHKLFITTPIIALGTCVLLIGLILVRDGVGGRGSRIALIEVRPDAGENRAYIEQEQVCRTGVLLGSAFEVGEQATLTPVPIAESPWARLTRKTGGAETRFNIDLTEQGMTVEGDTFQSRSEQGQLIRAVIPTRGRIEIKNAAGPPVFVSSFDFPIDQIHYIDPQGGFWQAGQLRVGEAVRATSISESAYLMAIRTERDRLANRHNHHLERVASRRDHFVATSSAPPMIGTLDSIDWESDHAIITGPIAR